jgi:predicted nucleic acid-binding protein
MKSVDTNILVRLLTGDDPAQYRKARKLFESSNIFIPDTVVLETEWVLRYAYSIHSKQICTAFRKLFGLSNVRLTNAMTVSQAITWHESGLDFADAMHLAASLDHDQICTFDIMFAKKARSLCDCKVTLI